MKIRFPFPRRSVAARGHAIYRKKVRPLVYPREKGKVVIIDVRSGDYEIGADSLAATDRLLARRPDAVMWGERIGYKAVAGFGGFPPEDDD